jgi:hypothetical protein
MNQSTRIIYFGRANYLLRAEGLIALIVFCFIYQKLSPSHWGLFLLLFLSPDVSLLGYLLPNRNAAAAFYNLAHSYVIPLALGLIAWKQGWLVAEQFSLIWLAHIGFDRSLGYGLKMPGAFNYTHIQSAASVEKVDVDAAAPQP